MKIHQHGNIRTRIVTAFAALFLCIVSNAQCPPNIDFENGDFSYWTAYTGNTSAAGPGQNLITLNPTGGPVAGIHEIFNRLNNSTDRDYFGGFPVVCPNGSGYSVKLGNTQGGAQADGLSYEFTIPPNMNNYSITYHYAVVFEGPNHREEEQPRLEIEVMNLSDNKLIECSSFKFIPFGSGLPGFFEAPIRANENTPIYAKDWTAVTINLNGQAGKTIRLFFKTADCTFVRHFGYAYIDVNTECTAEFTGATYCPNDTLVNVVAPFGFQDYRWFNSNFSQILGTNQQLVLRPPYPTGSLLAVEVTPFNGYGCKDTLYARLVDTLSLKPNAGRDAVYCGSSPVILGENPKPGLTYQWSPATGLSNPSVANPLASPATSTQYVLTVYSGGGGCFKRDTVFIISTSPDTTLRFAGKEIFCRASGDSAVLSVSNNVAVQWYRDGIILSGSRQNPFRVSQSGTYYGMVRNPDGCELRTRSMNVVIEDPVPGQTYPIQYTFANVQLPLTARSIGNEIAWMPPLYLSDAGITKPIFERDNFGDQLYRIRMVTPAGCVTVDTQLVKTIKEVTVFVPNNDNLNDRVYPVTDGIRTVYSFKVFSRWGVELFNWPIGGLGWDGTYKGTRQDPGAYVWQFSGIGIDGKLYNRKGIITVIR
jgi:CHU_C Type IX secretion signal domain